jgi:hypothetical protein
MLFALVPIGAMGGQMKGTFAGYNIVSLTTHNAPISPLPYAPKHPLSCSRLEMERKLHPADFLKHVFALS